MVITTFRNIYIYIESNMDYSQVKTSGVRAALFSEDILIKRQVGDLTPMSSIQLTPDKYEVKNIETSIFLERILHTFYRLLKTLESFRGSSLSRIGENVILKKQDNSDQFLLFLRQIEFFMEHVIGRIEKTSEQERVHKEYYRKIWHANEKAHQDINDLSALIETQHLQCQETLKNVIYQYTEKCNRIKRMKRNYETEIKTFILKSERNQVKAYKTSLSNQNNLMQAVKEANINLEKVCMKSSLEEKELAARRIKTEAQLAGAISKYDSEIGGKQNELDELAEEYKSVDTEFFDLQKAMETQLEIYDDFIKEREESILKIFREKLEKFMVLRATKIIQKWWRKIYWRYRIKSVKGKNKKKSKGKKKN